jgi:hypothetical protein
MDTSNSSAHCQPEARNYEEAVTTYHAAMTCTTSTCNRHAHTCTSAPTTAPHTDSNKAGPEYISAADSNIDFSETRPSQRSWPKARFHEPLPTEDTDTTFPPPSLSPSHPSPQPPKLRPFQPLRQRANWTTSGTVCHGSHRSVQALPLAWLAAVGLLLAVAPIQIATGCSDGHALCATDSNVCNEAWTNLCPLTCGACVATTTTTVTDGTETTTTTTLREGQACLADGIKVCFLPNLSLSGVGGFPVHNYATIGNVPGEGCLFLLLPKPAGVTQTFLFRTKRGQCSARKTFAASKSPAQFPNFHSIHP